MNPDDENQNLPPHQPDGLELVCAGILSTEFGRKQSNAVAKAVAQLAAMETNQINWRERLLARWQSLSSFPRFAFATAILFVIGIAVWSFLPATFHFGNPPVSICAVTGELGARWAGDSVRPKIGDSLTGGSLHLASGVVEFTFATKAKVAVEGPARISFAENNSMELQSGKLSTEVPARAHGFSVKTPNATVVDLGTRFGLNVADGRSEVDVFEGKVQLTPNVVKNSALVLTQNMAMAIDAAGAMTPATFSETIYPHPSEMELVHPVNCGFDGQGNMTQGGLPSNFGLWSGPAYELSGGTESIAPMEGRGMLRFETAGAGKNSEVWQLMDMSAYKILLARGDVQIKSSAFFNRVAGDANSAKKFGLTIAAFHGQPKNVEQLWARRNELALVVAEKELDADDNPATWEKIEVSAALPAQTDFLIVEMRAIAPDNGGANPFPGHFADLIDCTLTEPLQAGINQ